MRRMRAEEEHRLGRERRSCKKVLVGDWEQQTGLKVECVDGSEGCANAQSGLKYACAACLLLLPPHLSSRTKSSISALALADAAAAAGGA